MIAASRLAVVRVGAVAMLLFISGCESDTKETAGEPAVGISFTAMDSCYNCHADGLLGKYPRMFGQDGVDDIGWLFSSHGNYETLPDDLGVDNEGDPSYADFSDAACSSCHDPIGDGGIFSVLYALFGVSEIGRVDRPVVGCESCHGAGGNHWGIGPMPHPRPDAAQCGACHNDDFPADHAATYTEGDRVFEDHQASPHAGSKNPSVFVEGSDTMVTAECSRCHTDDGAKLYLGRVPGTTDYATLTDFFSDKPALSNPDAVECRTCHDVHNQGKSLLAASTTGPPSQSDQFNTCTACHQLNQTDGTVMTGAYHDPAVNTSGSLDEVITDSHAAVPGDTRLNTGGSAAPLFFVKKGDDRACAGCHNPHDADNAINEQYANSAHGNTTADGWIHYDWKHSGRAACQRCHTTTGFVNYADDTENYDPADNDFSHLLGNNDPGARVDTDDQLETIYCWGCHTDSKGTLRDPGPITPGYEDMENNPVVFPDISGSNVCMACHTGRESGGTIQALTSDFSNRSFVNSHYLTGGATVFKASGYEYSVIEPTLDYSNVEDYKHDKIGSDDAPGTGSNGPCAGCHMRTPEPHVFQPVAEDGGGAITAILSTACSVCHDDGNGNDDGEADEMTAADLEDEKAHFLDALAALDVQLQLRGFYFFESNPYFFKAAGGTGGSVTNWLSDLDGDTIIEPVDDQASGKPNMGAAFNYNMLHHDPGAYTHNRFYVKRLIYDSIDWLDNLVIDDSVFETLNALDAGTDPYKADAMDYLLSESNGRP